MCVLCVGRAQAVARREGERHLVRARAARAAVDERRAARARRRARRRRCARQAERGRPRPAVPRHLAGLPVRELDVVQQPLAPGVVDLSAQDKVLHAEVVSRATELGEADADVGLVPREHDGHAFVAAKVGRRGPLHLAGLPVRELVAAPERLARPGVVHLLADGVPARQRRRWRAAELGEAAVDVALVPREYDLHALVAAKVGRRGPNHLAFLPVRELFAVIPRLAGPGEVHLLADGVPARQRRRWRAAELVDGHRDVDLVAREHHVHGLAEGGRVGRRVPGHLTGLTVRELDVAR